MTSSAKNKAKFRRSSKWTSFRRKLKYKRKVDELTLKPLYAGFNLHHIRMDEKFYEDLSDEEMFACLNKQSHNFVHWAFNYYKHDADFINRLENLLKKMKDLNN